jgi:hypothetical protein
MTRKKHKVSGSEPIDRSFYNNSKEVLRHNCMSYAFGEKMKKAPLGSKQQPGNKSKAYTHVDLSNCDDIVQRILDDYHGSVYQLKGDQYQACKKGWAKVIVAVSPNSDFHFYRQEADGFFTHKRGLTHTTGKDACNKKITDPLKSCRNYGHGLNYKLLCGTFCRKVKDSDRYNLSKKKVSFKTKKKQPRKT